MTKGTCLDIYIYIYIYIYIWWWLVVEILARAVNSVEHQQSTQHAGSSSSWWSPHPVCLSPLWHRKATLKPNLSNRISASPCCLKFSWTFQRFLLQAEVPLMFHHFWCLSIKIQAIWRFPEIGVPPNHPFLDGIFSYKPSILGHPIDGNPHIHFPNDIGQLPRSGSRTWFNGCGK